MLNTNDILDSLRDRKRALSAELGRVEKALSALAPEDKPKADKTKKPANGDGGAVVTREAVLTCCVGDGRTADAVATLLACDGKRAAQVLSALFKEGKLTREGDRGSYVYRAKSAEHGSPFQRSSTAEA